MPSFTASFTLYRGDTEFKGEIPPQKFTTEGNGQNEFWNKLFSLEKSLSQEFGGSATHLLVTADEAIPGTNIKKGEIVAYNSLEL